MQRLMRSMSSLGMSTRSSFNTGGDSEASTETNAQAKLNWAIVRQAAGSLSRDHLLANVLKMADNPNPNTHQILRLGQVLLEEAFKSKHSGHTAASVYAGALLIEWVHIHFPTVTEQEDEIMLARAHCEIWKGNAVAADPYNLKRSLDLFTSASMHMSSFGNADIMLDYSKVLQYAGEIDQATKIFMTMLSIFEERPEFPSFVFLAGGMLKAQGDFDKAGSYFFEAMNIGPPRLFSRLDMMFIVARTLEEATKDSDEPVEDGYKMVHHHLTSDGFIPETLLYNDWINDANTWLKVADKCAIVGLFSLAADLYGQGINRDKHAFRKTRLWLGFAKACTRCGKNSEAQLALKQALSLDPHNVQCRIALEQLADLSTGKFEKLANGPLNDILPLIPHSKNQRETAAMRVQAILRGRKLRQDLALMHGNKREYRKRLTGCVALRLLDNDRTIASLIIKLRSYWNFTIKEFRVLDALRNDFRVHNITSPILAPCRFAGQPKKYFFDFSVLDAGITPDDDARIVMDKASFKRKVDVLQHVRVLRATYRIVESDREVYQTQHFEIGMRAANDNDESVVDRVVLRRLSDSHIGTDNHTYTVAKSCFLFEGSLYNYTIVNSGETTRVTLFKLSCDQKIVFVLKREYIDLTVHVKHFLRKLLGVLKDNFRFAKMVIADRGSLTGNLFAESPKDSYESAEEKTTIPSQQPSFEEVLGFSSARAASYMSNVSIGGILCSITPNISYVGADFEIKALENVPVFSHSFEINDGTLKKEKPVPVDIMEDLKSGLTRKRLKSYAMDEGVTSPLAVAVIAVDDGRVPMAPNFETDSINDGSPSTIKSSSRMKSPSSLESEAKIAPKIVIPENKRSVRLTVTPNLSVDGQRAPQKIPSKLLPPILNEEQEEDLIDMPESTPDGKVVELSSFHQEKLNVSESKSEAPAPGVVEPEPLVPAAIPNIEVKPKEESGFVSENDKDVSSAISSKSGRSYAKSDKQQKVAPPPAAAAIFLSPAKSEKSAPVPSSKRNLKKGEAPELKATTSQPVLVSVPDAPLDPLSTTSGKDDTVKNLTDKSSASAEVFVSSADLELGTEVVEESKLRSVKIKIKAVNELSSTSKSHKPEIKSAPGTKLQEQQSLVQEQGGSVCVPEQVAVQDVPPSDNSSIVPHSEFQDPVVDSLVKSKSPNSPKRESVPEFAAAATVPLSILNATTVNLTSPGSVSSSSSKRQGSSNKGQLDVSSASDNSPKPIPLSILNANKGSPGSVSSSSSKRQGRRQIDVSSVSDNEEENELDAGGSPFEMSSVSSMLTTKEDLLKLASALLVDKVDLEKKAIEEKRVKSLLEHQELFKHESEHDKQKLFDSIRSSKKKSTSMTENFVRLESMRIEAMSFLTATGKKAVITVNRSSAFDYLAARTQEAQQKLTQQFTGSSRLSGLGLPQGSRHSSFIMKNQKGNGEVNFDISKKRSMSIFKRRQSIMENNAARKSSMLLAQQEVQGVAGDSERRTREDALVGLEYKQPLSSPPSSNSLHGILNTSLSVQSLSKTSSNDKKCESPPPLARETLEMRYFQGKTTDAGYFPDSALQNAAILVAALQGRLQSSKKTSTSPDTLSFREDGDVDGEEAQEAFVVNVDGMEVQRIDPINSDVLSTLTSKLQQHKEQRLSRKSTRSHAIGLIYDEVAGSSLLIDPIGSLVSQQQQIQQQSQYVPYRKVGSKSSAISTSCPAPPRSPTFSSTMGTSPVKKSTGTAPELLRESLHQFNKVGYGSGDNSYRSHWIEKLDAFSDFCHHEPRAAAKAIAAFKKLAHEIKLTESEMFCVLADAEGNVGEAVGKLLSSEDYASEVRSICSVVKVDDYLVALSLTMQGFSRSPTVDAAKRASTAAAVAMDSGEDLQLSRKNNTLLTAVPPRPLEMLRLRSGRFGVMSPENPLPHFGMNQTSRIIKSRGNRLTMKSNTSKELSVSRSVESFVPQKSLPNQLSQSVRFEKAIEQQLNLVTASGQETVVMSRRDAMRALQDELLQKSPDVLRLSRCGFVSKLHHHNLAEHAHDWYDVAGLHHYRQHPERVRHSMLLTGTPGTAGKRDSTNAGGRTASPAGARKY